MHIIRITTDLTVPDIEEARAFYADYLGLKGEDMGLDWVTRFVVPNTGEHIQLVSRDATSPENPLLTVKVDDVDDAYAEARRRGYEVVHPLTTEPWGIRRFFVRAPDGTARWEFGSRDSVHGWPLGSTVTRPVWQMRPWPWWEPRKVRWVHKRC